MRPGKFATTLKNAGVVEPDSQQNPFPTPPDTQALVQCWECGLDECRSYGIGKPSEIRCRMCNGRVEVLTVNGVPQ